MQNKIYKLVLAPVVVFIVYLFLLTPTNDKNWTVDAKIAPEITFSSNATSSVTISKIKNFSYGQSEKEYEIKYDERSYALDQVESVYYLVNPFWGYQAAHTFLTFGFKDGRFLSVSVEARKVEGDSYNPLYGIFKKYNIFYMLVDEKDIVTLRTVVRDDRLYSFKLKLSENQKQALFKVSLERAKKAHLEPEFYNTLFSSCTTNIFDELNQVLSKKEKISFDWRMLIPEDSAEIFYERGMLDTATRTFKSFQELKEFSEIQNIARKEKDQESGVFSQKIH